MCSYKLTTAQECLVEKRLGLLV